MNDANWVIARADCTARDVFNMVADQIKNDIKVLNNLTIDKRNGKWFLTEHNGKTLRVFHTIKLAENISNPKQLIVKDDVRAIDPNDRIELRYTDTTIIASQGDKWTIDICWIWNKETLTCDFIIDDCVQSLALISQKIIGDFLFQAVESK